MTKNPISGIILLSLVVISLYFLVKNRDAILNTLKTVSTSTISTLTSTSTPLTGSPIYPQAGWTDFIQSYGRSDTGNSWGLVLPPPIDGDYLNKPKDSC